jgi:hypothetical protein
VRHHRLNYGSNRQFNQALHIAAITQARHATDGASITAQAGQAKTDKEALRALKRQLSTASIGAFTTNIKRKRHFHPLGTEGPT